MSGSKLHLVRMRREGHPGEGEAGMAGLSKRATYRKRPIVGALTIATLVPTGCANTAQIDVERPLALVYDGPQSCDECAPAIAAAPEEPPNDSESSMWGRAQARN